MKEGDRVRVLGPIELGGGRTLPEGQTGVIKRVYPDDDLHYAVDIGHGPNAVRITTLGQDLELIDADEEPALPIG